MQHHSPVAGLQTLKIVNSYICWIQSHSNLDNSFETANFATSFQIRQGNVFIKLTGPYMVCVNDNVQHSTLTQALV